MNIIIFASGAYTEKRAIAPLIVNNLTFSPGAPLTPHLVHYSIRTVHSIPYCHLHGRTNQYLYSFFPHTIDLWNNLWNNLLMLYII